jgi:hypothetical protein
MKSGKGVGEQRTGDGQDKIKTQHRVHRDKHKAHRGKVEALRLVS